MTTGPKKPQQGKSKSSRKSNNANEKKFDFNNYDSRALEKDMWILAKLMKEQEFKTFDEANDFLKKANETDAVKRFKPDSAEDQAQCLAYDAFSKEGAERRDMAMQALEISENCPDAYVILAEMERDNNKKMELYTKGVKAGEKVLGKEIFDKDKGHFWGITETRPYMRAMEGLATALWNSGQLDRTQEIYERLIELNPNDNQGNRYSLLLLYMYRKNFEKAKKILNQYDEDSAEWNYSKALLLFLTSGVTIESKNALKRAFKSNKYVPVVLLREGKLPPQSNYISPGEPDEAISYVRGSGPLWLKNLEALKWLVKEFSAYMEGEKKVPGQFRER
ncbi:MAG: tetratricopeptide repeat protein [Thermoplasmataceae archaeon]